MIKFLSIFLLLAYIFPLSIAAKKVYIFEYLQIILLIFAFYLGSWIMATDRQPRNYTKLYNISPIYVYASAILYLALKFPLIIEILQRLFDQSYAAWALEQAKDRYELNLKPPINIQIGTMVFYIYSVLLGAIESLKRNKILLALYVFFMFVESSALARAGVLISLAIFFVEVLIRHNAHFCRMKAAKYFTHLLTVLGPLFIIFAFSFYFRSTAKTNLETIFLEKLSVYTIAMYQALFVYMHDAEFYYGSFGFNTFAGFFKIFGISAEQGFYGLADTDFGSTNIYTIFRGLLSDFTYIGCFFIMMASGSFVKKCTYCQINFIEYYILSFLLTILMFALYSPFIFFNVLFAHVLAHLLIFLRRQ